MNTFLASVLAGFFSLSLLAEATHASPRGDNIQDTQSPNAAAIKKTGVLADRDNNRLSDRLQARITDMAKDEPVDVIITFIGPVNHQSYAAAAQQLVGPFKLRREFTLIRGFSAAMTVGQAEMLSHLPDVFRVEEDPIVSTQLSGAASDFGAVAARTNYEVDGSGIGICLLDTGIDANHEQFAGRTIDFLDLVNSNPVPYDDHGHGTHVAAIVFGGGGTGDYSKIVGVAPAASIYAVKVLDALGSGSGSQIIEGIQYCVNQTGAQIISMSLGTASASDGSDAMSLAVNCASDANYSTSCNVVPASPKIVVVAAGNSGSAPNTVGSPGAAEKAITVGAATNWSENGKGIYLAAFSSRGPTLDGRIKPDISAPGVRILSAKAGDSTGYISYSGTSMATPFTAGSIALMLQQNPLLLNNAIPADGVRDLLIGSSQDRGVLNSNNTPIMPDSEYGGGLLDVNRAVALAGDGNAGPTAFPRYDRYKGFVNSEEQQLFGPFSITTEAIAAGVPFAATVTIEGKLICAYGDSSICDLLGGWEWDPDLDVYLLDDKGNLVTGGPNDITRSECALSGEYCGVGRQETIHYLPQLSAAAGNYYIAVTSYAGSGYFLLEVSSFAASSSSNKLPVANAGGPYEAMITKGKSVSVTLDGSGSTDEDGTIVTWIWTENSQQIGSGETLAVNFKEGVHTLLLTVSDNNGLSDSQETTVTVTKGGDSGGSDPDCSAKPNHPKCK